MADKGDIPFYDFSHKYRGFAIIIVNENFYGANQVPLPDSKRKGALKDLKRMTEMFNALDFKVKAYKDLTGDKMREKIQKASWNNDFNKKADCFALVISSHGEEVEEKKARNVPKNAHVWRHCVQGSDLDKVYIDDVMSFFEDKKANKLKGKPKLFFIQACRSRYGNEDKKYDYGTFIKVAVKKMSNVQPSDANDVEDNAMFSDLDGVQIEDVYDDLPDAADGDEWNESQVTSDDDYSDEDDIADAKGDPDSGRMPPSPPPERAPEQPEIPPEQPQNQPELQQQPTEQLQYPQQPEGEQDLSVPDLSVLDLSVPDLPQRNNKPSNQTNERIGNIETRGRGAAGDQGSGDQEDAGGSQDTGVIPQSPFDVVPIKCPQDCLIVYPSMSGANSFRRADLGSRLLHCMSTEDNLQKLVMGCDLLQYLTEVSGDMAKVEIRFNPWNGNYTPQYARELEKNMPFKVTTVTSHRLTKGVMFEAKKEKSMMAVLVERFKRLLGH